MEATSETIHIDEATGEPTPCGESHDGPGLCGDCFGGTDLDPYVNGSAYGWSDIRDELAEQALEPWERAMPRR